MRKRIILLSFMSTVMILPLYSAEQEKPLTSVQKMKMLMAGGSLQEKPNPSPVSQSVSQSLPLVDDAHQKSAPELNEIQLSPPSSLNIVSNPASQVDASNRSNAAQKMKMLMAGGSLQEKPKPEPVPLNVSQPIPLQSSPLPKPAEQSNVILPQRAQGQLSVVPKSAGALAGLSNLTPVPDMSTLLPSSNFTEEVIDVVFSDGQRATYTTQGLSFTGGFTAHLGLSIGRELITYGNARINRTVPMAELARQLPGSPGISSAVFRSVPLSPLKKYIKEVAEFERLRNSCLSPQQHIDLYRRFLKVSQHYQGEGVGDATQNISVLQALLGIELANLGAGGDIPQHSMPIFREALTLLEESARSGDNNAVRNLPTVNYLLGVALVRIAHQEDSIEREAPLLREGVNFLTKAKQLGRVDRNGDLKLAQSLLAQNLYQTVFPKPNHPKVLSSNDIATLREAFALLMAANHQDPFSLTFRQNLQEILDSVSLSSLPAQELSGRMSSLTLSPRSPEALREQVASARVLKPLPSDLSEHK